MTGNEYQQLSKRTIPSVHSINNGLALGAIGLGGESGEVQEIIKKHLFHKKPLSVDMLKKELGDVMWYIAYLCTTIDITLDDVMTTNVDKLKLRYPDHFDSTLAHAQGEVGVGNA